MLLLAGGCSGLLPTVEQTVDSRWDSYEATRQSFDRIAPGRTTVAELRTLGFDPFENSNIRVLNYLDVTQRFIPNASIRLSDLDPAIRACLKTTTACRGYELSPKELHRKRHGNVLLDVFNFRRKTTTTGWTFDGLIVLEGDLVVYKLEGGQPRVLEQEDKKNPLGPLQDISVNTGISVQ
jgi:hypothetical protein